MSLESVDTYEVLVFGVCLILSAFFSASETAITSLGSLKAKHLIDTRGAAVEKLNLWLTYPERVLTTILIFNNVVNILASALATDMATRHFENQAIGIATGVTTFLVLIFGEIIPKSFAKANHETLSVIVMRIISIVYTISFPLVWLLSEFSAMILRLMGSQPAQTPPITEEEIEFLIHVGERAGVLEQTKKEMISGVFDIDETKVREVMTPRTDVKMLESDVTLDEALGAAIESGFSRIPVYDTELGVDNIVGILLVKDLLRVARDGIAGDNNDYSTDFKVTDVMRDAFFIPESKLIIDVFRDLKRSKNHIAMVIDEHGGTAGLVTMEDILEEIVGEIQDEYDVEEAEILELEDGIFDVAGSVNFYNFLEFFDLDVKELGEMKEDDVDTLAGLLTQIEGDLPESGKTFRIGPLNVEVTEVERNRVQRLRVSKVLAEAEESQDS
jgi:CBS domain containing-hemolysin-like protein